MPPDPEMIQVGDAIWQRPQWRGKPPALTAEPRSETPARWLCTDIEAA